MPFRKLRDLKGSGAVCIAKDDLRRDGLVDEEGRIKEEYLLVERVDEGEYRARVVDPDEYPGLQE